MLTGPVDFDIYLTWETATVTVAAVLLGILHRRQERHEAQLRDLDKRIHAQVQHQADKHDTSLSDLWQALEDHRLEARRSAADVERRSADFREATLRQLGNIEATLARLERHWQQVPPPPSHPPERSS